MSGSTDNTIKIWNTEGECIKTLEGHSSWVESVAIDGDRIVSGSWDNTIKIWDMNTGKCLKTLKRHRDWVNSVAIEGDRIVSGSDDETIKIWNIDTTLKDSEKFRLLVKEAATNAVPTTNNDDNDTNKCPVCFENVSNLTTVTCPNNHTICKNCICRRYNTTGYHDGYVNMSTNRSTCPICRTSISGLEDLCH